MAREAYVDAHRITTRESQLEPEKSYTVCCCNREIQERRVVVLLILAYKIHFFFFFSL